MTERKANLEKEFAEAPLGPLIFKMAVPSIAAQIVNLLYSIVDRIFIGHLPDIGTDALAGVGLCSAVILLISAFAQIVGGGGAPLASIALGKGKKEEAEEYLGTGVLLLLIFAAALAVPVFLFRDRILTVIGASAKTLPYASSYLSVYLAGTLFVMITIGLNSFLYSQGRARTAMAAVFLGAITNTVLDPLFLFAFHMGVKGAALATVIAQALSAAVIVWNLMQKEMTLRIRRDLLRLRRHTAKKIISLGISPFVMSSTESLIGFVLNRGLASFGDIYVSALAIMQSGMQFISIPLVGFAQGANPVISYTFGHGDTKRLKEGFWVVFRVMVSWNFLITLFLMLFPGVFAGFFTGDPELIAVISRVMPTFMCGMLVFGLQRTCQNMFISMDEPGYSLFIALLRKVILLVPLALILPKFMGVMGIFRAEAIADALAATICILLFSFRFRKILEKMEAGKHRSGKAAQSREKEDSVHGIRARYADVITGQGKGAKTAGKAGNAFSPEVQKRPNAWQRFRHWFFRKNRGRNAGKEAFRDYIGCQGGGGYADDLRFGLFRMSFNGCEVIALYNLLLCTGHYRDIREIAADLETDGAVLLGGFGTRPDALMRYLTRLGDLTVSIVRPEKIGDLDRALSGSSAGILSFWNGPSRWTIHTVMVRPLSGGGVRVYNAYVNAVSADFATVEEFLKRDEENRVPISLITAVSGNHDTQ